MYVTETINLNEIFPKLSKRPDGEDYVVSFTPISWLPMGFQDEFGKVGRSFRELAGATELPEGKQEEIEIAIGTVLSEFVTDWNLTDRNGDVPLPTKENPTTWKRIPTAVIMAVLNEAGDEKHGAIPFQKESQSEPSQPEQDRESEYQPNRAERRAMARTSQSG